MERVREEIAKIVYYIDFETDDSWEQVKSAYYSIADDILRVKVGNHTLKELIEMIDKGELVKLAGNQTKPEPNIDIHIWRDLSPSEAYQRAQDDMQDAGFRRVEPLK